MILAIIVFSQGVLLDQAISTAIQASVCAAIISTLFDETESAAKNPQRFFQTFLKHKDSGA